MKDDEAITILRENSEDFRRLEREHRRLDEEILRYNKKVYFSSDDEFQKKRLQKLKLYAKDKMAEMIRDFKKKAHSH